MVPASALRRFLALAALLAVVGGVVGLHDGAAAHEAHWEAAFAACDLDHGRATHVESARRVEPHDCAACIHRLHSRGGAPEALVSAALAAGGPALPAAGVAAPPFPPLSRSPSRGPPLA